MRMLARVTVEVGKGNEAISSGNMGKVIGTFMERAKPEAAYFTEMDGKRTAVMVVNLEEPSKVPALAEPWFLQFNADVHFQVVMSGEDLKKAGLEALGKKWG